jgi:hypothetical protein
LVPLFCHHAGAITVSALQVQPRLLPARPPFQFSNLVRSLAWRHPDHPVNEFNLNAHFNVVCWKRLQLSDHVTSSKKIGLSQNLTADMFARRFPTLFAVKFPGPRTAATVAPLTHAQLPYAHIQRGSFAAVWHCGVFFLKKEH